MWQQWVNFLAGIWLIISPYVGFTSTSERTNMVVTGVIVAVLAIWGAMRAQRPSAMMR